MEEREVCSDICGINQTVKLRLQKRNSPEIDERDDDGGRDLTLLLETCEVKLQFHWSGIRPHMIPFSTADV